MFTPQPKLRSLVAATRLAFALPLVMSSAYAFDSGSTGADGALNPTVNTEIQLPPSGVLNYTTINIPAGVTVTFKKNALNTPVYLLASGNVTIAGTLDVSGKKAADVGTAGDGLLGDDGQPGVGGPGGFDGGRGGVDDLTQTPTVIRGGAGLGPGGAKGGTTGGTCTDGRPWPFLGGSAGYATAGSEGPHYYTSSNGWNNYCSGSTAVGSAYGSSSLQPLIGGSGGGGGLGGTNFPGSGGGGGGGALLIASSGIVSISGAIKANGGNGGLVGGPGVGGPGGAGSGGAVRVVATSITGTGSVSTSYACPNNGAQYVAGAPYTTCTYTRSSNGRVRLEAESLSFTGSSVPAYSVDSPAPVFLANMPSLRISSVAGQNVPAVPTGVADLTFPAELVNPVTVTFSTTNVPTGNTVQLKLIPAYGPPVEVLSPAITGTTAAGTASVQVTLPQGPSTLQATTTYTIVVAMGEALSVFAKNERVEKVQLIATLGGEGKARLITISGKEYEVPMSVLQQVGFAG